MRTTRILTTLALLVALTAGAGMAQQKFTDPGLVPGGGGPGIGNYQNTAALTFYANRGLFQAAFPGLPLEDFSGSLIGPGGVCADTPPLNSSTNDGCFGSGGVIAGFSLDILPDAGSTLQYVLATTGFLGIACNGVGPNSFVDDTSLDFSPAVAAVAFDLTTIIVTGSFTVEMFGPGGSLGSTTVPGGGTTGTFFGVSSNDLGGITRVEIREDVDGLSDLLCNLEFGGQPVPVELESFDIE